MAFHTGDRVRLVDIPNQPWFDQTKQYTGEVVSADDGNTIVMLDEPVEYGNEQLYHFSFQGTALVPERDPYFIKRDLIDALFEG